MHFSALAATSLALSASAFLVPLEVSSAAQAAKSPLDALWSQQTHIVQLDCPGCPFAAVQESDPEWTAGIENRIEVQVAIDDEQRLRINNVPVYPARALRGVSDRLFARQIRASDSALTRFEPIGYALVVPPPVTSDDEPDEELITLQFTILDLKGTPVHVDTLRIDILKVAGECMIVRIESLPFQQTPGAIACLSDSKWSLCRLRAIISERVDAMLEGARFRANRLMGKGGCSDRKGIFGRPSKEGMDAQEYGRHGYDRHHHFGGHRIGHLLYKTLRYFIVPALLGVIGGLMACAVGMLVGQLIVFMWFRVHHNGQRGSIRVTERADEEDEKDGLMGSSNSDDAPPEYADVAVMHVVEGKQ